MTWVKLGEERVNTDHVAMYQPSTDAGDGSLLLAIWLQGGGYRGIPDPDGALLRALDEACFPPMGGVVSYEQALGMTSEQIDARIGEILKRQFAQQLGHDAGCNLRWVGEACDCSLSLRQQ
jgi:hypothetical protein